MADIIPVSALLPITDYLAGIYNRQFAVSGTGAEAFSATLNGSITATAMSLVLGDWTDPDGGVPPVGTLTIGSERIRYRTQTGTTITVEARGADGTIPAAHLDGATVYLPSSVDAYAKRITQEIIGDGTTALLGLGEPFKQTIADLMNGFVAEQESLTGTEQLRLLVTNYFSLLNGHIAKNAGPVLGAPVLTSFGPLTISNLSQYLRYLNDAIAYQAVVSWQSSFEYWLFTGGDILDNKSVWPGQTTLSQGTENAGGGVVLTSNPTAINRYGVQDAETWTQGYIGQAIRARVTAADTGTVAISLTCQGMDNGESYFGRPKTCIIRCLGAIAGIHVVINGVTLTSVAGTTNPDPNPSSQFAVGASNAVCVANLVALIESLPALSALFTANPDDPVSPTGVVLTINDQTGTTNYPVTSDDTTHMPLEAGSKTQLDALGTVTLGGGNNDGTGADSDVTGDELTDDPRAFTGVSTFLAGNSGSINNSTTTLLVESSAGFPAVPFVVKIGSELLHVTTVASLTWTVARGYLGSSAASHNDGVAVTQQLDMSAINNVLALQSVAPSTTVTTGASSATQVLASTVGIAAGDALHFLTAGVFRTVKSVTDGVTLVLTVSVSSTTGERVTFHPERTLDRVLQIVTQAAVGASGATGTGRLVIETVPDRVIT